MTVIWTIGHSNKDISNLLKLLESAGIQTVIDCRSKSKSRWVQFNAAELALSLAHEHIKYEPRGKNIGGFGENVSFDDTLDELAKRAEHGDTSRTRPQSLALLRKRRTSAKSIKEHTYRYNNRILTDGERFTKWFNNRNRRLLYRTLASK